jgi:hypothetical protein
MKIRAVESHALPVENTDWISSEVKGLLGASWKSWSCLGSFWARNVQQNEHTYGNFWFLLTGWIKIRKGRFGEIAVLYQANKKRKSKILSLCGLDVAVDP